MISPTAVHERTVKVVESLVDLYTVWHEAEPDAGYDAKAAQWRDRLGAAEAQVEPPADNDG